jgi:pyrroloquinoline quinone biosynthesis protein D
MTNFDFENTPFRLNPNYQFQWEQAQDCYVLLYPEGLIKLNGSAAEIIQRCISQTTFAHLVDELTRAFPGAEDLADDLTEFLNDAQQQDWIVPASAD